MSNKNVLIFGAGAIGSHLAYCLSSSGLDVDCIVRGKHYKKIIKHGLLIKIYNNKKLLKKKLIKNSQKLKFFSDLNKVKKKNYNYIFVMNKINSLKKADVKKLSSFIKSHTSIIPQCTQVPFWLDDKTYLTKSKDERKDVNFFYNRFFPKKKIIGMSAWVSAIIEKPGVVKVKHIQRGYPMKEISECGKNSCDFLRNKLRQFCISPIVKNIGAELYIKSLNALAFNLVALNTQHNNKKLYKNKNAIKDIYNIMDEGDKFLFKIKAPIPQSINSRIKQTLGSTEHTMSMLSDHLKGKKTEIEYVWASYFNLMNKNKIIVKKTLKIYKQTIKKIKKR